MDVSIIIVNFNTFDLTTQCLRSVYERTSGGLDYEVILVDNASSECDPDRFTKEFPGIRLVKAAKNLGFAGGNNLGIERSSGRNILLLNSDAELGNDAVSLAHRRLESDPRIGALSAKLIYPDGRVQLVCNRFPSFMREAVELLRLHKLLSPRRRGEVFLSSYFPHEYEIEVDWIWGAFLMFPRKALAAFPNKRLTETFFMYGEDREWCYLIKAAGYSVLFYPDALVVHHLGGSGHFKRADSKAEAFRQAELTFLNLYYPFWEAAAIRSVRALHSLLSGK